MSYTNRLRAIGRESLVPGAAAGVIGGVFFALGWLELGMLSSIASLVRADSAIVGLLVHLGVAALAGAVFGFLVRGRWGAGDTLLWGVTYAAFFWFLGPLTLTPLIMGSTPAWDVSAAQAGFPSLLGHILWGAATAIALLAIKAWPGRGGGGQKDVGATLALRVRDRRGLIVRGLLAGLGGFLIVSLIPAGQDRMLSAWGDIGMAELASLGPFIVALVWGVLYALLHPRSSSTAGGAVVRGAGYGFVLWVVAGLTLLPLLAGNGIDWSIPDARAAFPAFVGSTIFGASMALLFHWLTRLTPVLFSDADPDVPPDGGSWGPRAVLRGAVAGLAGGLVFTLIMIPVGYLSVVASLVGSASVLVGLATHLVIAMVIGASYGAMFRRQAFDAGAAVGWGVSYGFVWWLLGPLTLAPIILGAEPAWSVGAAASAFPGLVGHLAFGAALGLAFYTLEARYMPWWISRSQREIERMAGRRRAASSAGPALWALLVLVAVLLPTVLAAPMLDEAVDADQPETGLTGPLRQPTARETASLERASREAVVTESSPR